MFPLHIPKRSVATPQCWLDWSGTLQQAPVDRQVYSWQILIGKLRNSASERAADHKYLPYSQFQLTAKYFQGVDRLVTSFVVTSLDSGQRSYSRLAWLAAVNKISTSAETLLRMTEITEVHIRGHLISAN